MLSRYCTYKYNEIKTECKDSWTTNEPSCDIKVIQFLISVFQIHPSSSLSLYQFHTLHIYSNQSNHFKSESTFCTICLHHRIRILRGISVSGFVFDRLAKELVFDSTLFVQIQYLLQPFPHSEAHIIFGIIPVPHRDHCSLPPNRQQYSNQFRRQKVLSDRRHHQFLP